MFMLCVYDSLLYFQSTNVSKPHKLPRFDFLNKPFDTSSTIIVNFLHE